MIILQLIMPEQVCSPVYLFMKIFWLHNCHGTNPEICKASMMTLH